MKKVILLLLVTVIFLSCKDEVKITSYQVFNNTTSTTTALDPYLNGSMYEVIVFCYAGTDVVREDNYTKIACGETTVLKEVPETITKIKVSFKLLPPQSAYYNLSSNTRKYVVSYTLIESDKNVVAEVNDNSMLSSSMSVKQQTKQILKQ